MRPEVRKRIREEVQKALIDLRGMGYKAEEVSEEEFYIYLTVETFYKEKYGLHDVLDNEFLILHEVVEISELKKMEFR